MNIRKWSRLALALTGAVLAAACGSGTSSGDDATTTATVTPTPTQTATPTPTPTGTPAMPITLTEIHTADGAAKAPLGKCIGFTVNANDAMGVSFSPTATVTLGPLGNLPVIYQDSLHLRVGDADKDGQCFDTPFLNVAPGVFDVVVSSDGSTWTLPAGFELLPPVLYDLGDLAKTRVWTADKITDTGANVFEIPYDVDIYKAKLVENIGGYPVRLYLHADFFTTGPAALLPETFFWNDRYKTDFLGRGGFASIFPQPGLDYIVVRDSTGLGSPTSTYDISMVGDELATTTPSDNCHSAPAISTKGYHVNYDVLSNQFDPQGSSGCVDSIYGNPIYAPGNDAVWTVTVPAGKELRVSGYDDHIDNVTYLLPMSDYMVTDSAGCPVRPTNCVAAAGHFGGGNTDVMIYDNKSASDEQFFLVHDSATVMTNAVGSFLIDVELFDAH